MLIHVHLTPKADRDAISKYGETNKGMTIYARVRAIPEKGKANIALIKIISKWLDIPKSDILLHSGSKSRIKTLKISGNENELEQKLAEALLTLK